MVRAGIRDRGVITDHLEFGRRVLHGLDLYAPYLDAGPLHAPYPPAFGLMTAPFTLLPERAARFCWAALQVLALWGIGAWLADALRRCAPGLQRALHWLCALTAVLAARFVLRDTHGGGGNTINLALALLALLAAGRGRPWCAGALLGFSLATKPVHVLVVPLLWILGKRRAAVIAVAAALAFTALSLLLLRQGLAPLQRWAAGSLAYSAMTDVCAPPDFGFPPFTWMNQGLRCAVQRWLGVIDGEYAAQVPGWFDGLGLAPPVTAWISRLLAVLLLAVTARAAWRQRGDPRARPWLVAAVACLSLLLSPISWKAHHVALVPAIFLLACRAAAGARRIWWVLFAFALLCVLGEELVGKDLKQVQQSLYLVTAATVALWACCIAGANEGRSPAAAPQAADLGRARAVG